MDNEGVGKRYEAIARLTFDVPNRRKVVEPGEVFEFTEAMAEMGYNVQHLLASGACKAAGRATSSTGTMELVTPAKPADKP